jgi:cytochrome c oxidase cbb3-type subunit 3
MRANKHLLLWSSLGTLAVLVWAAYAENFQQEWRYEQRRYRSLLPAEERGDFNTQLRQIVLPALNVTDRCVSCHVGMAPGESGIAGDPVLGPHPRVTHDPATFGCTTCHSGQGLATAKDDAHGDVAHWPEPMIPQDFAYAGCGACHTHLAVPNQTRLERGRGLFERYDCLACHRMDGRGGTLRPLGAGGLEGPDLSVVGVHGYDQDWYRDHINRRAEGMPWTGSFRQISADEQELIDVYLSSRVGAPGLVEAKSLFHSLGCRGCHSIGGVGGDDGPDLTIEGHKDPGQIDFDAVHGPHTLENWMVEHFRAPARVAPGSQMPVLGLEKDKLEELTFYMLSLRRSDFPEAFWPVDRIRAVRFDEREFSTDGGTLYGTFCAACHGPSGEGMRYPGMAAFPAIANPDFLSLASDDFLRKTINSGRPGRRMPAWGEKEGGLRPEEVDAIVDHVRALGNGVRPATERRPARWVEGDAAEGDRLYRAYCSGCHGGQGEGGEGPALNNRVLLESASDTYLMETIRTGRGGTSMEGFVNPSTTRPSLSTDEIEAIVTHIRSWEDRT